jgi:hypothetical protein
MASRSKWSGAIGPLILSTETGRATTEWQRIAFPEGKAEIEEFIANQFVAAFNRASPLQSLIIKGLRPNDENSLDFTLSTSEGDKWLELMEIAPFELYGVSPDRAPNEYRPYDLADFLHRKIMQKSRKYRSARPGNIFLLLYLTDWRFVISESSFALLQYWCNRKKNSFEAIFVYMPITATEGLLSLIAPTPSEFWKAFDPEVYRRNVTINVDPSKWISFGTGSGPEQS